MPGPHPAVALTRRAVRHALTEFLEAQAVLRSQAEQPRPRHSPGESRGVVVGVSGGADSLALAAALAFEAPKLDVEVEAVIVDHGLQPGSADVAHRVMATCRETLGLAARVCTVEVVDDATGPEGAARTARYAALRAVVDELEARCLMVAHTGDDQAEQVMLGLLRGSGTRTLAGMRPRRDGLVRPFLIGPPGLPDGPVMRVDTEQACVALNLPYWTDPHNDDDRFSRSRVRRVLRTLESDVPAPALRRSLVRTAEAAARDADYLDRATDEALARTSGTDRPEAWPMTWPVEALAGLDPALRTRALRRLLLLAGAPGSQLSSRHLLGVESLLVRWRGQGPVDIPGHLEVARSGGELAIYQRGGTQ